jgi:hypothetical protein
MGEMIASKRLLCAANAALAACVSTPTGPGVTTLPGVGKSYEQFRADNYECRQYAQSSIDMTSHDLQRGYDTAYAQCMHARGNEVPMRGPYLAPARN